MAGFLDSLKIEDPATAQGLLQFGLSLLQSKGGLANALGAAGMQGLQGSQQFRDRANAQKRQGMLDQLTQQQIAAGKRQQAMQELPGQFTRAPSEPGTDATGGIDTALTNPNNAAGPGGFDANGYAQALRGIDPEAAFRFEQMTRKAQPQPIKLGQNERYIDPTTGRVIIDAMPDKAAENQFIQMMRAAGIAPESAQGKALLTARLSKDSSHAPPVSIANYGSPVPYQMADGTTGYVQPANKAGAAPVVMADPKTGLPFKKPPEQKAPPVEFTKSVAGLKELENGLTSYEQTLKAKGGVSPMSVGGTRAALTSSYTSLQMGMKNAFELGALAGPDLALLQGMLIDPTSPQAAFVGDKGVAAQIKQAREYLKNRGRAVYDAHKLPVPGEYKQEANVQSEADRILSGGR